jgi:hypothetical protein
VAEPVAGAARLSLHGGARATEAAVLAVVDELCDAARRDPALLAAPVRVVVPSSSLRLHLSTRLAERGSRLGVQVQTHFSVALEVLERTGRAADVPRGRLLFELLPRRLARREPALAKPLERLEGGFRAVTETVQDLLDAGLEPPLAEGVEDLLTGLPRGTATPAQRSRGAALVRVAAATAAALEEQAVGHPSRLFDAATQALLTDPDLALPARAVLLHGFADATGRVTDLLEALLKTRRPGRRTHAFLDRPPDPAGSGPPRGAWPPVAAGAPVRATAADRFGRGFVDRLSFAATVETRTAPPLQPPTLDAVEARGCEAEVFDLALSLRALLDAPDTPDAPDAPAPEAVAVVARDLTPYRRPLRRWLPRFGIPFTGLGEPGSVTPGGRRAAAFLDLLRDGADALTDRFLDAGGEAAGVSDLRLAGYALGLGRLRDLAELEVDAVTRNGRYVLPARQGLEPGDEDDDRPARAQRRSVSAAALRSLVRRARQALHRFDDWPLEASLDAHLDRARALLPDLGDPIEPFDAARRRLLDHAPSGFVLDRDEWLDLLRRALDPRDTLSASTHPPTAGVRILTVTEARALTFGHLFLLGLHKTGFPRVIRQDALLPDPIRRRLRTVLPDLPVKDVGHDEERYLFAQLLTAAPRITLSWQTADDAGAPRTVSPLVERLRQTRPLPTRQALSPTHPPSITTSLPADLHLLHAALLSPRSRFRPLLPLALEETRRHLGLPPTDLTPLTTALATARLAVLDELDPDLRTPEGRARSVRLGPYFGFLGELPPEAPRDPRTGRLSITLLERLAGCPWQVFLERLLGLEPTPDPLELPAFSPLLVGNVAHGVLDEIVRTSPAIAANAAHTLTDRLDAVATTPGAPVPWPSPERLEALLSETTREVLAEEGLFLPGLRLALMELIRPLLDAAREADWSAAPPHVVGTETTGTLTAHDLDDRPFDITLRADRVDHIGRIESPGPSLRLTDYKTGKPLSTARTPDKRRDALLARVTRGDALQAVAYAAAGGNSAEGRYLYLKKDVDPRDLSASADDDGLRRALEQTLRTLLTAWRHGSFFPRLVDPAGRKEPARCGYCNVAEACLRHDSGARGRLTRWSRHQDDAGEAPATMGVYQEGGTWSAPPWSSAVESARRLWFLPDRDAEEDP